MKQRFEKQGFKLPQSVKSGALLLTAFAAWHYLGLTFYNTVSTKGQDALRREGVSEDDINKSTSLKLCQLGKFLRVCCTSSVLMYDNCIEEIRVKLVKSKY